jgi:hypothetical protein
MSEVVRSSRVLRGGFARRSERPFAAIIGALLVLLACAACGAGADVHAVRDPSYGGRIRTLYLAIGQGGINEEYANGFVKSFQKEMGRRHIGFASRVLTGLELDRQVVDREVVESHADAALLVRPVRGITDYGEIINLTWEVSLFDAKTGAKVWRAQVENKKAAGMFGSTEGMVDEAAVSIAQQLEADHLLGSGG